MDIQITKVITVGDRVSVMLQSAAESRKHKLTRRSHCHRKLQLLRQFGQREVRNKFLLIFRTLIYCNDQPEVLRLVIISVADESCLLSTFVTLVDFGFPNF